MKPSLLPTLAVLLLAGACGLERIELRPRSGVDPATAAETSRAPDLESREWVGEGPEPVEPSELVSTPNDGNELPRPFDLLPYPEGPAPTASGSGCSKIDLLFVLDNSLSMIEAQSQLAAAFPGLRQALEQSANVSDLHVLVTDTDDGDGIGLQLGSDTCEDTLGAGKRRSSARSECGIAGPERYLTSAQPEIDAAFACLADVGASGDFAEQPMAAMTGAVSAALNVEGGCNAGFLRDDALLVVTIVTDEDDRLSSGAAEEWRQSLLDAKSGDDAAVVVLGLLGDNNVEGGLLGGPCSAIGADGTPELQRFSQLMQHGALGSVCALDYTPFFEGAVSTIQAACGALVAPSP
jgi:hypothetical protein